MSKHSLDVASDFFYSSLYEEYYSDVSHSRSKRLRSLCAHVGVVKYWNVSDITSTMYLLTGSPAYFIADIYELMQKMQVPGTRGGEWHQLHLWGS